jgi:pimeloyl-ACP methyl ester carboxylesterase
MQWTLIQFLTINILFVSVSSHGQSGDSIVLKDIQWDKNSPAGTIELFIPSGKSLLAGFIYRANGAEKHPTLLLLHGYPGTGTIRKANHSYFDYEVWETDHPFTNKRVALINKLIDFLNK